MDTIREIGSSASSRLSKILSAQRSQQHPHHHLKPRRAITLPVALSWLLCATLAMSAAASPSASSSSETTIPRKQAGGISEAELNSIVQQHSDGLEPNSKLLAEAIISRLMLDNLTGSSWSSEESPRELGDATNELAEEEPLVEPGELSADGNAERNLLSSTNELEALRLKKLLGLMQNYDASVLSSGGLALVPLRALSTSSNSQAATMKRAALRMVQQQQHQRHLNPYARNNFDFGLGKRQPEGSASRSILRFGDSFAVDGQPQPVSHLGKRPSAHRYDFGLGKRVASVSIPRALDPALRPS